MINKAAWSITDWLFKPDAFEQDDREIYAFGLECILGDVFQALLLVFFSILFKCAVGMAIFTFTFATIKRLSGGWHANSHFACISLSTLMSVGSVLVAPYLPVWVGYGMLAAAWGILFILAPIPHRNNPKSPEELKTFRKKIVLVASVFVLILCVVSRSPLASYFQYGVMGLFMPAASLLIPNKEAKE